MVEVAEDAEQPAWLGNGPAREFLAVPNTLLDLGCLQQSVTDCLEALTPDWFSPVVPPVHGDRRRHSGPEPDPRALPLA